MDSSRTYSIAGRFAIATLLWASLTRTGFARRRPPRTAPPWRRRKPPRRWRALRMRRRWPPSKRRQWQRRMAALDVPLIDAAGDAVGLATFSENADGVTVRLLIEGLSPGEHGWHLHEFGVCDPDGAEPFSSAGEHWNPTAQPHGGPDADEHHVGDFGNLVASEDGLAEIEITTTDFTFEAGPNLCLRRRRHLDRRPRRRPMTSPLSRTATAALAMPAASLPSRR